MQLMMPNDHHHWLIAHCSLAQCSCLGLLLNDSSSNLSLLTAQQVVVKDHVYAKRKYVMAV